MTQTQNNERRGPNPLWAALEAAGRITSPTPGRDQPEEMRILREAMGTLDQDGKRKIVFRLVRRCLFPNKETGRRLQIQALFPAAREARMTPVAYNTDKILKAITAERCEKNCPANCEGHELSLLELRSAGLVDVEQEEGTLQLKITPHVGMEAIKKAEPILREAGKLAAADILRDHVRGSLARKKMRSQEEELRAALAKEKAESKTAPEPEETPAEENSSAEALTGSNPQRRSARKATAKAKATATATK